MTPPIEKRLLQAVMIVALPLSTITALRSIAGGPSFLGGVPVVPTDLDSHFRYLSGVFLGMLIGYASCIPGIERKGARLTLLVGMTVLGGLARAASLASVGAPSIGHLAGLGIELAVAPALWLWQRRVAARF